MDALVVGVQLKVSTFQLVASDMSVGVCRALTNPLLSKWPGDEMHRITKQLIHAYDISMKGEREGGRV